MNVFLAGGPQSARRRRSTRPTAKKRATQRSPDLWWPRYMCINLWQQTVALCQGCNVWGSRIGHNRPSERDWASCIHPVRDVCIIQGWTADVMEYFLYDLAGGVLVVIWKVEKDCVFVFIELFGFRFR